jgi:hypothetical protein
VERARFDRDGRVLHVLAEAYREVGREVSEQV